MFVHNIYQKNARKLLVISPVSLCTIETDFCFKKNEKFRKKT